MGGQTGTMNDTVTANVLFDQHKARLKINWIAGHRGRDKQISGRAYNLQQHALIGHLNLIHPNRIQIIGRFEHTYFAGLDEKKRLHLYDALFSFDPAVIIFSDQIEIPLEITQRAEASGTPLWNTSRSSSELISDLQYALTGLLAQRVTLHGVLLEIFGLGVLITGKSGIGKSELALELISRGHHLIADDAPEFRRIAPDILAGSCPITLQNFLEVRGLGVLNIAQMFGDSAVLEYTPLSLIINLQPDDHACFEHNDRLTPCERKVNYLDVDIIEICIPVAPGRNLAVIAESCVRNEKMKMRGKNPAQQIALKQRGQLRRGTF
jgi:HPr kinase/phosphorylase